MTVKEFLETSDQILLKGVAKKMYPTNADAASYLVRKLKGTGRPFTKGDAEKAIAVLKELSSTIDGLTIE